MKKILFVLIVSGSLINAQWLRQYPPSNIDLILSIDFAGSSIGAAGGWQSGFTGSAVYTTNAGLNWVAAVVPDSSRSLVKLQLIDNSTGYIAGAYNIYKNDISSNNFRSKENRILPVQVQRYYEQIGITGLAESYKGLFLKTTNGGKTWFTYGSLPSNVYYLLGMCFINAGTGFVTASLNYSGGVQCSIMKTTNGGQSWNNIYTMDSVDFNNIFTIDGINIFAGGWQRGNFNQHNGFILKSSNGGNSWGIQSFPADGAFYDISFTNSSTGYSITSDTSDNAIIYKTTNTGINWTKLSLTAPSCFFEAVEFVKGTGTGIVIGEKFGSNWVEKMLIYKTTNYGTNWTYYYIPDTSNLLHSISIIDINNWYIAGGDTYANAIIFKTTNGGNPIGIEPISGSVPDIFELYQNYPNPFNPTTKIKFAVPSKVKSEKSNVKILIYNMLGREIAALVNEQLQAGTYEVEWNASNYPSGVYFYTLTTNNFTQTKRMVLIK